MEKIAAKKRRRKIPNIDFDKVAPENMDQAINILFKYIMCDPRPQDCILIIDAPEIFNIK